MAELRMDDEELRRKWKELGEDVCVTDSSRKFLIKKLKSLNEKRGEINDSPRRSLLNFSSDESESDSRRSTEPVSGNSAILGSFDSVSRRTRRSTKLSNSSSKGSEWNDDHFRQPRNPLRRSTTSIDSPRRPLSTSEGTAAIMTPTRHYPRRVSGPVIPTTPTPTTTPSSNTLLRTFTGLRKSNRSGTEANFDINSSDSDVSDSSISNIPENTGVDEFPISRRSIMSKSNISSSSSRETFNISRRSNTTVSGMELNNIGDVSPLNNGHHGLLEEEPISTTFDGNASFASTASESALKNHSQCISRILLIILAFFFLAIGVIYFCYRVPSNALETLSRSKGQTVTEIAWQLSNELRVRAGNAECETNALARMTVDEAGEKISVYSDGAGFNVKEVFAIFEKNKNWGIKGYDVDGEEIDWSNSNFIYWLQSSIPDMPWLCKLKKAWTNTVYKLSLGLAVALVVAACTAIVFYWKERSRKEQQEVYCLVEKILESLQNNYNPDNTLNPYTPIPHVRDQLIPPSERPAKRALWDAAVKFIQENESRVRQEVRMVKGEDISVWHWLPADQSPLVGRSRTGRLWQGQAFENLDTGVNALPYSPTPCLKVRNMFDPETECEDNWTNHIKDEILEKCSGLDIIHMMIDESLQGCVYIKCKDEATAGQVFKRLHGSWFDGKLVTVKYLRLERYHERFPISSTCTKPLKSSTLIAKTTTN